MIWYSLIALTLLYYLILWVVLTRKKAMERTAKEVFGPATGIQDLHRKPLIQTEQKTEKEKKRSKLPSREQLFAGTSLDKEERVGVSTKRTNQITIQLQDIQKQSVKAELNAIVAELQSFNDNEPIEKEKLPKNVFDEYGLSDTMQKLFKKDMQEVMNYNKGNKGR